MTYFVIALLIVFLLIEMPIAVALIAASSIGLWAIGGTTLLASYLQDTYHEVSASYVFLVIPMFVLLAEYMAHSGLARELIKASNMWLGRLRGGLAIACVIASAFMAAIIGSSTASCATMSAAAYPTMREMGYGPRLSIGVIAIAGTLAIMIPPSVILILYGILTELSVGKLLIAGLVPGIITAFGYILTITLIAVIKPSLVPPSDRFDLRAAARSSREIWPVLLLILLIIGGLYSGIATPTEIGALGAFFALIIILVLRRITLKGLWESIEQTLTTTIMIVAILVGAMMFGYFLTLTQATQNLIDYITQSGFDPWTVMGLVIFMYVILGMFMSQIAILVLTVPVVYPIVASLGFDGIWFGIIITKAAEIGLVTPPVGLNVYVAHGITKVPLKDCFIGVTPFIFIEFLVLGLLVAFPQISLFLPNFM